jgi:hypothetical protein
LKAHYRKIWPLSISLEFKGSLYWRLGPTWRHLALLYYLYGEVTFLQCLGEIFRDLYIHMSSTRFLGHFDNPYLSFL